MKRIFYFAYGSNLLTRRLEHRVGQVIPRGIYVLQDYELVFNCGGFANIIPSRGNSVEGYMYEVTADQISELNRYEALYNAHYFDVDENTIAVVYVGSDYAVNSNIQRARRTDEDYVQVIMAGCIEKRLPATYAKLQTYLDYLILTRPRKVLTKKSKRAARRR